MGTSRGFKSVLDMLQLIRVERVADMEVCVCVCSSVGDVQVQLQRFVLHG